MALASRLCKLLHKTSRHDELLILCMSSDILIRYIDRHAINHLFDHLQNSYKIDLGLVREQARGRPGLFDIRLSAVRVPFISFVMSMDLNLLMAFDKVSSFPPLGIHMMSSFFLVVTSLSVINPSESLRRM